MPAVNFNRDSLYLYLEQISKISLLSQDEVVHYASQVQRMMHLFALKKELCKRLGQEPSFAQWAIQSQLSDIALKSTLQEGQRAKRKLVEANLRLVVAIARRHQTRGVDLLDLIQEGTIALSRAVDKFDPTRGYKLSTYAYRGIRREIVRATTTKEQRELVSIGPDQQSHLPLPDETVAERQRAELVRNLVNQLPPKQQSVLTLLYGLRAVSQK